MAELGKQRSQKGAGRKMKKADRRNAITLIAFAVLVVASVICFTPINQRITQGLDIQGGLSVVMKASHQDGSPVTADDMEKAVAIVTNRVNRLGASEATVQSQGTDSILIQIPGVDDAEQAIKTIGTTGTLEFVDLRDIDDEDVLAELALGEENIELKQGKYKPFMTGNSITGVTVGPENEHSSYYAVNVQLNGEGTEAFAKVSKELVATHGQIAIVLDGVINSAPAVQSAITNGQVAITGNYTMDEAKSLQTVLQSGALPVNLDFSESRVVGPTLGQDSLMGGLIAMGVGFLLVAVYLIVFYRGLGLVTVANLLVFAMIYLGVLAVLSHYGLFALSLAGIAGIVLTIGMAADSSVLVLERFKEELRMGRSIKAASISGVRHAIGTSIDADLVSLVSGITLLVIAIGSVKGFGLTLSLGIICDILTMLLFKAPAIRLLALRSFGKNTRFWGIEEDLELGAEAEAAALMEGGANA